MHELTSSICANSREGEGKQLTDKRDSKKYQVTKLKDGNCWMTQNLDYNGGGTSTSVSSWPSSNDGVARYHDPSDATYGNYYSWEAALQVCPNGWQLPTGNKDGEFQALADAYGITSSSAGSNILRDAPLNFQLGGYLYSGELASAGSEGIYWSSTAHNSVGAYNLYFNPSNVNSSNNIYRYYGLSVRCLVQGS